MKKTLITEQDRAYLAESLLNKGYEIHGIKRHVSSFNTARIDHLYEDPHDAGRRRPALESASLLFQAYVIHGACG